MRKARNKFTSLYAIWLELWFLGLFFLLFWFSTFGSVNKYIYESIDVQFTPLLVQKNVTLVDKKVYCEKNEINRKKNENNLPTHSAQHLIILAIDILANKEIIVFFF